MTRQQSRSYISASYVLLGMLSVMLSVKIMYSSWQVNNPATGEIVADVACMGVKETNDAIASSYEAFPCM